MPISSEPYGTCPRRMLMIEKNDFIFRRQAQIAVALGKKHAETSYPNSDRAGCPGATTLRSMAQRDSRLELNAMPLSHVVTCSPCFMEYSRYRRSSIALWRLQWAG